MDKKNEAIEEIVSLLLKGETNLEKIKRRTARKYRLERMIRNSEILGRIPKSRLTPELSSMLLKKPVKTLSGVSPIAVMIRPEGSCGHRCIYCPFSGKAAKSYTGWEPAAMRARENLFDPYGQASSRVRQLDEMGHATEKCEIIIMGGTFLEMSGEYKDGFVKGVYDGLNSSRSKSLAAAIKKNETAKHRAVGLTIETRPDVCSTENILEILSYGGTRVELGVQNPDDGIYAKINRGHGVKEVVKATKLLKDSGFKVLYHVMPGLPGSDRKKDVRMLRRLFEDSSFRPDMLKIYPTLVLEGTELHSMMKRGEYEPYSAEEAAEIIAEFFEYIPEYVRVMRIQRDIPAQLIDNGVKKSNLRELVMQKLKEKNIRLREIRSREAGLGKKNTDFSSFSLKRKDYDASGGKEIFLSFENKDDIIGGFLRLRIPEKSWMECIGKEAAIVRELHVYGKETPLRRKGDIQHRGMGSVLLKKAEEIAKGEFSKEMLAVISGVGVREYYRKKGYLLKGYYMAKRL